MSNQSEIGKTEPSAAASRGWGWLIVLAAILAFEPALFNEYAHDDIAQVERIEVPSTVSGWVQATWAPWWPPEKEKYVWRPLTRLTILLQKAAAGDWPRSFYLVNILLHAGVSWLLWRCLRKAKLNTWAAGLAGLLFAVHPVHAEAIHQVVGRAELLAAGWMLLGLWLFSRFGIRSPHCYWQQPFIFALALGSKEHAILYPGYLALWMSATQYIESTNNLKAVRRNIGALFSILVLLGLGYLQLRVFVTGGLIEPPTSVPWYENPLNGMSFAQRLPIATGVFGYAVSRLVWPFGLSPDYSARAFPVEAGWVWPWTWIGIFLVVGLLVYTLVNVRKRNRGWALVAGGLAAWLLISNIPFTIGVITAERLWYWPSVAGLAGLGWLIARLFSALSFRAPVTRILATGLLALGLMLQSWQYATAWRSQLDYAAWTVERFPESWRGHLNLAREYYRLKDFKAGLRHAQLAVRIAPDHGLGWDWVGVNAMFLERHEMAETAFQRALDLDPSLAEVYQHLATCYRMQGEWEAAARALEQYLAHTNALDRAKALKQLDAIRGTLNEK